jgi:hypothetical protein
MKQNHGPWQSVVACSEHDRKDLKDRDKTPGNDEPLDRRAGILRRDLAKQWRRDGDGKPLPSWSLVMCGCQARNIVRYPTDPEKWSAR